MKILAAGAAALGAVAAVRAWLARRKPRTCRCGHPREAHEHYRPGIECSLCEWCRQFAARPGTSGMKGGKQPCR